MANNLKSMIKVIANSDAIARLNECLDKCETGDIPPSPMHSMIM